MDLLKQKNALKISLLFLSLSFLLFSCSKKADSDDFITLTEELKTSSKNISWYYFTKDSIFKTDSLENTPKSVFKPWQDSIRVTDSFQTDTAAFMLVNKNGILYLSQDEPELIRDSTIFKDYSTGSFLQCGQIPLFNIYRNNFFDTEIQEDTKTLEQIIYQFRKETKTFYPVISKNELKNTPVQEVTNFIKADNSFYAMTRDTSSDKIKYTYFSFADDYLLFKIKGSAKSLQLQKQKESQDNYRQLLTPVDFSQAPKRIRALLGRLPASCPFIVKVNASSIDKTYPCYIHENENPDALPIECKVLLAQNYSIAVFEDGTTFFSGALPDKYIIANGEPIAFRLPKLLPSFTYTDIALASNKLYVAWEEVNFYETGRAGFLVVELENILY